MKLLLAALLLSAGLNAAWEPAWSRPGLGYEDFGEPEAPRKKEAWERFAVSNPPPPERLSLPSLVGSDFLLLWQNSLSGHDGSHCPHYPSCSRYSRIAIEDYGLTLGVMMTAERLIRCHDDADAEGQYPKVEVDGELMIWNPPQDDAWWEAKP